MPKAYSIHFDCGRTFSHNDAVDMFLLCQHLGYAGTEIHLGGAATTETFFERIPKLADKLCADDLLLVSFAAHGEIEADPVRSQEVCPGKNISEAVSLQDGQLWDCEIQKTLSLIRADARVVIVADLCHSGDIADTKLSTKHLGTYGPEIPRKSMPASLRDRSSTGPGPTKLLLAATNADDLSYEDGRIRHGIFTGALLGAMNNFKADSDKWPTYQELYYEINRRMVCGQHCTVDCAPRTKPPPPPAFKLYDERSRRMFSAGKAFLP